MTSAGARKSQGRNRSRSSLALTDLEAGSTFWSDLDKLANFDNVAIFVRARG